MERKIQFSLFYMGIITAIIGIVITTFVCYDHGRICSADVWNAAYERSGFSAC